MVPVVVYNLSQHLVASLVDTALALRFYRSFVE
jgi:hypothetical protein